jgi:DNA polymerase-1
MPPSQSPGLVCLVDGSGIFFRAYHALPPLATRKGLPTGAIYGFTSMLVKLLRESQPTLCAVVVDAPGRTFRDEAFADYKATRTETPSDLLLQLPFIKQMVDALGLPLVEVPGVEADDVIGTLARQAVLRDHDVQIVTSDKDMMQLVGPRVRLLDTMYDRTTGVREVEARFGVSPAQVVEVMALMGDSIDNIPGVKGIGEKTATRLIQHFGSIDALYARLDEIESLGLRGAKRLRAQLEAGAEDAVKSRYLATIRCDLPLDVGLADLTRRAPDADRLAELAVELEFTALLRDFTSARSPREQAARDIQPLAEAALASCVAGELLGIGTAMGSGLFGRPAIAIAAPAGPVLVGETLPPALAAVLAGEAPGPACLVVEDLKRLLHSSGVAARAADPPPSLVDISIASYVLDPSRRGHGIDALAAERLRISLPPDDGSAPAARAAGVAAALAELGPALAEELARTGQDRLYRELELPIAAVLARIEARGIAVDRSVLEAVGREFEAAANALEAEIHALAGGPFKVQSQPQLREVLFDRLGLSTRGVRRGKTGLSVDAEVLARLAEVHPIAAKVIEHRTLSKLISTYVSGLLPLVDPETSRLHTSFNQTVAATGRLSSSEPNLQNIPIRTAEGRRIRAAFVAPPGTILLGADYSQIELRLLAHLTRDPVLVDAFARGEDIHRRTAAEVFAVAPEAVTRDQRRRAKVINFGILYGMGPQRLSRELAISLAEAEEIIRRYFERYSRVKAFAEQVVEQGRALGYVTTMTGRRRPLPDLNARAPHLRQAAERMAWNSPIQGSAADIIKLAMIAVERELDESGLGASMLLQVHDELLFEVPEDRLDRAAEIVRTRMESVVDLAVPLVVDLKSGPNWASLR